MPSDSLLARYLAAEATAEERAAVEAWASENPENAAELDRLRSVWGDRAPARAWNVDRAWTKVEPKLSRTAAPIPIRSRASWNTPLLRIAAVLVLVAGLGIALHSMRAPEPIAAETFASGVGERREIVLSDSTQVTLAPMSELRIAENYGRTTRRVDLTGEAWFEVRHDPARSFEVHAAGTITEDIGTAFAIRAMLNDSIVRVVVAEGIVATRYEGGPDSQRVELRASDAADFGTRSRTARIQRGIAVAPLTSWRAGAIEFNDAPLADVGAELARWYGVAMRFERPEIARRPVSYTMPTNDIAEALRVLSLSLGVALERRGDTIVVR